MGRFEIHKWGCAIRMILSLFSATSDRVVFYPSGNMRPVSLLFVVTRSPTCRNSGATADRLCLSELVSYYARPIVIGTYPRFRIRPHRRYCFCYSHWAPMPWLRCFWNSERPPLLLKRWPPRPSLRGVRRRRSLAPRFRLLSLTMRFHQIAARSALCRYWAAFALHRLCALGAVLSPLRR